MDSTIVLSGYVGNDIEVKKTRTGASFINLRMGTTPRVRRGNEWVNAATTWTTVVCYRNLADNVASSVFKGDPVLIEGHVRTQTWTDSQGEYHERTLVEATAIGHDLNRGTSSFTRVPFRVINETAASVEEPDDDDNEPDPGADDVGLADDDHGAPDEEPERCDVPLSARQDSTP